MLVKTCAVLAGIDRTGNGPGGENRTLNPGNAFRGTSSAGGWMDGWVGGDAGLRANGKQTSGKKLTAGTDIIVGDLNLRRNDGPSSCGAEGATHVLVNIAACSGLFIAEQRAA